MRNQKMVNQSSQEMRDLINKVLKRIIGEEDYVRVKPIFKKGNIVKLANRYSFTYKYVSEVQNKLLFTHYYVIYKDGSCSRVKDKEYDIEYADNTLGNIYKKNDIYVKNYLNKDTIAIVGYGYYTNCPDEEELIIYEI